MRTVRYAYVAVKTQISGRACRVPAACAGPSDSGQRLVHSSGRLGGDPVRTPNGLRSPPSLPSVRSLTEAEPVARRHPAAWDMGDRVRPRSTRPSAALAGTRAAAAPALPSWPLPRPPAKCRVKQAWGYDPLPPKAR